MDQYEDERKKQVQEITRLQKVNQEFQKEIFLLNEQKESQEKMMKSAFESFSSAQAKNAEMLMREKQNTERITRLMEEAKDKSYKATADVMKNEKERRDSECKLSRMTIEKTMYQMKLE